ncbi:MAG: MFS transporter [Bryobacteraceae bacterium]|nr:MFS transporter [Bryobacteraceae bacterium]
MNRVRWYIAGLLFLSSVINYVDRQVLSVVAPVLTKELHISPVGYANILQAFLIPYTLMYIGSGFLVDRWGARKSLAIFMVWWSTANMLHGFARGALSLAFFRGLLGIGEPGNFMAGFRAISEWYPPKEKAFVNGLLNGGAAAGAIVAPPLVAWLSIRYGWRMAFVGTGALGFLWLIAWLWIVPRQAPADVVSTAHREPWLKLLGLRDTWSLLLPRFVSDPVWWFYLLWLPKYLADQRGFTMREIGLLAWMPYLAADLGAVAGGMFTGWLVKRGTPVVRARAMGMWPFTLVMPLSVLIPAASTEVALGIICVVAFAHMAWKTNLQTVTNDIFPLPVVGSVSGIIAFGSGLGGSLFTSLTGWVVQHISYDAIFYVMGFLHPAAYLIFRALQPCAKMREGKS